MIHKLFSLWEPKYEICCVDILSPCVSPNREYLNHLHMDTLTHTSTRILLQTATTMIHKLKAAAGHLMMKKCS